MRYIFFIILYTFSNYSNSSYIANFETITKNKVVTLDYLILDKADIEGNLLALKKIDLKNYNEIWVNYKEQNGNICSNTYNLSFITSQLDKNFKIDNLGRVIQKNLFKFEDKFHEKNYKYYINKYFNLYKDINYPVIKSLKDNKFLIQKKFYENNTYINKIRISVDKSLDFNAINISYKSANNRFSKYLEYSSLEPVGFSDDYFIYDINIPPLKNLTIEELFIYVGSDNYDLDDLKNNRRIKIDYDVPVDGDNSSSYLTNIISHSRINKNITRDTIDISPSYNTFNGLLNKFIINNLCNKVLDSVVLANTIQIQYPTILSQIDNFNSSLGGPFNLNFKSRGYIEVPDIKFYLYLNYFIGEKNRNYSFIRDINSKFSSFKNNDKSFSLNLSDFDLNDSYITYLSNIDKIKILVRYNLDGINYADRHDIDRGSPFSLDKYKNFNNVNLTLLHNSTPLSFYFFKPILTTYPNSLTYNFPISFYEELISKDINHNINYVINENTASLNKIEFYLPENYPNLINVNIKFSYYNGRIVNSRYQFRYNDSKVIPIGDMLYYNDSKLKNIQITHDSKFGISTKIFGVIYSSLYNQVINSSLNNDDYNFLVGNFKDFIPLKFAYNINNLSIVNTLTQSEFANYFKLVGYIDEGESTSHSMINFDLIYFLIAISIIFYFKLYRLFFIPINLFIKNKYLIFINLILAIILFSFGYYGYFINGFLSLPELKIILLVSGILASFYFAFFYSNYLIIILFFAFYLKSFPLFLNQIIFIILLSTCIKYLIIDHDKT